MARLPRLFIAGCPQHVIQRGNNRQVCFFNEQDYTVYLAKLLESCRKHNVHVHAYVLMTNHVHLLLTSYAPSDVSNMMQSLGRFYVHYINKTYNRTGTLWEGRFKSTIVDSEQYLMTLYRYIELNPVRASMVKHPGEYPWSSFHHNALGKQIDIIREHEIYKQLGVTEVERQKAYLALFDYEIRTRDMDIIREATNKSWALSGERFIKQIEEQINRQPLPKPRGGDHRSNRFKSEQNTNNRT